MAAITEWDGLETKEKLQFLENRFKLFYTLKELWKENKRDVGDLYKKLFPSNQREKQIGNRTLYDKVLRLEAPRYSDWLEKSKQLEHLIGINELYFIGSRAVTITNEPDEAILWKKFIKLRLEHRNSNEAKSSELYTVEARIKKEIRLATQEPELHSKSEIFKRLVYFAQYGQKKSETTIGETLQEIEKQVHNVSKVSIQGASMEQLQQHYGIMKEYVERVQAIIILERWCQ